MAIDTVTNINANGAGSLAQTLATAAAGDTITFAATLAGATIDLASTLVITNNITIEGRVSGKNITLNGQNSITDISIASSATVDLDGLTIINGHGSAVDGTVMTRVNGYYYGSSGANSAGGILNYGVLTITNSSLKNNKGYGGTGATGISAGFTNYAPSEYSGGGAGGAAAGGIYNAVGASLTIDISSVTFSGNYARGGNGGQGGYSYAGQYYGGEGGSGGSQVSGQAAISATAGQMGSGGNGLGSEGAPNQHGGYGTIYDYLNQTVRGGGGGGGGGTAVADYGGSGTVHVEGLACFAANTQIMTLTGMTAVQHLRLGDAVVTRGGSGRGVIRWIGRRSISAETMESSPHFRPVRIRANTLGKNIPQRDLVISPQHCLFIDEVLIPAAALVNDCTITRDPACYGVEYIHFELDRHDVVLAEGALAETFFDDNGSRTTFPLAMETPPSANMQRCALLVDQGERLDQIRRKIYECIDLDTIDRSKHSLGRLNGHLECVADGVASGWVLDEANPTRTVELILTIDGKFQCHVQANQYRPDLDRAGLNGGRCGFAVPVPSKTVHVQLLRSMDLAILPFWEANPQAAKYLVPES